MRTVQMRERNLIRACPTLWVSLKGHFTTPVVTPTVNDLLGALVMRICDQCAIRCFTTSADGIATRGLIDRDRFRVDSEPRGPKPPNLKG
jgi:hypothetical protein